MRRPSLIIAALGLCLSATARDHQHAPMPDSFEIGRHTFFDVGPPSDYYEIFVVRSRGSGTSVARIILTPPVDACFGPAKVEHASASLDEPVRTLLDRNPCSISEKSLHKELKRCKKCLVFSGANVAMQARCGNETRIIRSDILDRDWFDPNAGTPTHTSWTMLLLDKLDKAVGPGVMQKPVFPSAQLGERAPLPSDEALESLGAGRYDVLFKGAPDKPSDLYHAAQKARIPTPTVELVDSTPFLPENFVAPTYPPLARLAHVAGSVDLTMLIDSNGKPLSVAIRRGSPLLRGVIENAAMNWKFPAEAEHQLVWTTVDFKLNCPVQQE